MTVSCKNSPPSEEMCEMHFRKRGARNEVLIRDSSGSRGPAEVCVSCWISVRAVRKDHLARVSRHYTGTL